MLRHHSAIKRARQNKKIRARNKKMKLEFHKAVKDVVKSKAQDDLKKAYSTLDKAIKKGVLHRNTAARKKSRLAKLVNQASLVPEK